MAKQLDQLRDQLDQIDSQIMTLLNQRMETVEAIATIKNLKGLPLTDEQREEQIVEKLRTAAIHPILGESVRAIFAPIFNCSKQLRSFGHHNLPFKRVGIVGLGLIGSSIGRALKLAGDCTLYGIDPKERELSFIDQQMETVEALIGEVELVIIASPITTVIEQAERLVAAAKAQNRQLTIIDVASVKVTIAAAFEQLATPEIRCIPTHPMAGREQQGAAASKAGLFVDAPWIITSDAEQPDVEALIHCLGAIPMTMSAADHDRLVALISHLPGVLASDYQQFVQQTAPDALLLAGPGYRSFTRLAHSNAQMRQQIAMANRAEIAHWLQAFIERLTEHGK